MGFWGFGCGSLGFWALLFCFGLRVLGLGGGSGALVLGVQVVGLRIQGSSARVIQYGWLSNLGSLFGSLKFADISRSFA